MALSPSGADAARGLRERIGRLREASSRRWRLAVGVPLLDVLSCLCLAGISVLMLVTLQDYGLTYDEEPHIRYGERVLEFYTGGFQPSGSLNRSAYGGGFDLCAALLRRISPFDAYRTNHVLAAFVAQVGLLGTWRLGRLLAGPAGGLLSLLFLVLTPVYYGHQFNNPKDIPFAAGYVWGLYFIARLLLTLAEAAPGAASHEVVGATERASGFRYWLGLGIALGLGMSVRVGGAILMLYLLGFLVLLALDQRWRLGKPTSGWRSLLWPVSGAVLGGWALMLVFWPRALKDPVQGPAAALETVSQYTAYDSPTLLRGQTFSSNHVPWDYLPGYFLVQLPELTLACFIAACAALGVLTFRCLRQRRPLPWGWWLLVAAVLVPPCYAIVRHSTLYNGLRHFLFIIPPLCVLAGAGWAVLTRTVARRWPAGAIALVAVMGLFVFDQVRALVVYHPHQQVFFNRASGGLRSAVGRYETEYYGSVYQELAAQLVEEVWRADPDRYLSTTFDVAGCGSKLFFTRNLPLNFQYQSMRHANNADFYATYVRDGCLKRFRDRRLVTQVERGGANIAVARDLRQRVARPPRPKRASP